MYFTATDFRYAEFDILVAWAYEDMPLEDAFEAEFNDIEDMRVRCAAGIDTHYRVRVQALYDGRVMGEAYLGSCYAHGCEPEVDIERGIDGYLDQLVEEAVDEARSEAVRMIERLKEDFLV